VEGDAMPFAPEGFVTVPVYDLRAAAGAGAVAVDASPLHYEIIREADLFGADIPSLFILEITGDSGLPVLHSGDRALCDRSQADPRREGLYIIRLDDVLQVKLLSMHPVTKLLTVKSYNPDYPTYTDISPDDIAVVARVIGTSRRLV
jgi:phage repressor protein C with HTH and peptisase S24 domain